MLNSFSRLKFVGSCFSLFGLLTIGKMIYIQNDSSYRDLAQRLENKFYSAPWTIYPERGTIYDRWGKILAINQEVYEIGVNLENVDNPGSIASVLSSVLGAKYQDIYDKASTKYQPDLNKQYPAVYYRLLDSVTRDKIDVLQELQDDYAKLRQTLNSSSEETPSLNGLTWHPYLQRIYPEKSLASNLIGFYAARWQEDGQAFYGVEEKYNDILTGTPVTLQLPFDPKDVTELPNVLPGASLVLTIDREIQANMERILDDAVKLNRAESGTLVVMDPKTGEILAMANSTRMDLNEYYKLADIFTGTAPYNRAIGATYEPGSVFKILTMAAALDKGVVKPGTVYVDEGYINVGGAPIHNWDYLAHGPQDMVGCLQNSLNVCLAWVATELKKESFYSYMQAFGIGHRTKIDLAGEVVYPFRTPADSNWYEADLGANSYGQGVSVTPIQLLTAVSAVANDGKMVKPHVVKSVIDNGRQYNTPVEILNTPIQSTTARTLSSMLATSLEQGEATKALVPGYRIAGKTGTASIPDAANNGYLKDVTNASFIGWGPIDDPRFMVFVWLEKPEGIWGSTVAAPVFGEAVKNLVVLMDIPPDDVRLSVSNP